MSKDKHANQPAKNRDTSYLFRMLPLLYRRGWNQLVLRKICFAQRYGKRYVIEVLFCGPDKGVFEIKHTLYMYICYTIFRETFALIAQKIMSFLQRCVAALVLSSLYLEVIQLLITFAC